METILNKTILHKPFPPNLCNNNPSAANFLSTDLKYEFPQKGENHDSFKIEPEIGWIESFLASTLD